MPSRRQRTGTGALMLSTPTTASPTAARAPSGSSAAKQLDELPSFHVLPSIRQLPYHSVVRYSTDRFRLIKGEYYGESSLLARRRPFSHAVPGSSKDI